MCFISADPASQTLGIGSKQSKARQDLNPFQTGAKYLVL